MILKCLSAGVLQALRIRSLRVWHPPDVRAYFFGRESREEHFRGLAEANSCLHFPDLAGKHGHSRVHQVSSPAHARKHGERVVVIPGLLQDNAIQLKTVVAARTFARLCCRIGAVVAMMRAEEVGYVNPLKTHYKKGCFVFSGFLKGTG